jgi:hypothetical protein
MGRCLVLGGRGGVSATSTTKTRSLTYRASVVVLLASCRCLFVRLVSQMLAMVGLAPRNDEPSVRDDGDGQVRK